MWFLNSLFPKYGIIYIKKSSILIIRKDEQFIDVNFPGEVFSHVEIKDVERFKKILTDFLKSIKKLDKYIIVLSDDVVFSAQANESEIAGFNKMSDLFIAGLPLKSSEIIKKHIILNKKILIYATNKKIPWAVKEVIEEKSGEIYAIVPEIIFHFGLKNKFSPIKLVRMVNSNLKLVDQANLLECYN